MKTTTYLNQNGSFSKCMKLAWSLKYGFCFSIYSVVVKYSKVTEVYEVGLEFEVRILLFDLFRSSKV